MNHFTGKVGIFGQDWRCSCSCGSIEVVFQRVTWSSPALHSPLRPRLCQQRSRDPWRQHCWESGDYPGQAWRGGERHSRGCVETSRQGVRGWQQDGRGQLGHCFWSGSSLARSEYSCWFRHGDRYSSVIFKNIFSLFFIFRVSKECWCRGCFDQI